MVAISSPVDPLEIDTGSAVLGLLAIDQGTGAPVGLASQLGDLLEDLGKQLVISGRHAARAATSLPSRAGRAGHSNVT